MKNYILLSLLLLSSILTGQVVTIVEADAEVTFNFLDDEVDGYFEEFIFTGQLNLDDLTNSEISGSVETKTIDTDNWLRSRHLRAKKYFNAKDFPQIKFYSTSISGTKNSFQVTGTLEIKGIKKMVVWSFTNDGNYLRGTTPINTSDFQIDIHKDRQRNKVVIFIALPYH